MLLTVEETESGDSHDAPADTEPGPIRLDHFHCDLDVARLNQPSIAILPDAIRGQGRDVPELMGRRTLRQVLEAEGALPSEHAIRIFLATCDAPKRVHRFGSERRNISAEHILVDSDGAIEIINNGTGQPSDHEGTEIEALGGLLYEMLTGKPQSNRTTHEEVSSVVPQRLREVIERALSSDPKRQYATATDLVGDVKREERAQFCKAMMILVVLFGFTLLLYVVQSK